MQRSVKDRKRCVPHEGTGKRDPAARATDFAAEKKKDLEESIRAEKKIEQQKVGALKSGEGKQKQREKKQKETIIEREFLIR